MRFVPLSFTLLVILFDGCSLAPELNVPAIEEPQNIREENIHVDKTWWKTFNDDALNLLIEQALTQSDDLKLSALKVLKARQTLGLSEANEMPSVNANASVSRQKTSYETYQHNRALYDEKAFNATLSYEIDLWGKLSSQNEANWSSYLASKAARETVRNTLIHDVFSAYVTLVSLRMRLDILEQTVQSYQAAYDLRAKQSRAGTISDVLANQTLAQWHNTQAAYEALKQSYALQQNALGILIGASPKAMQEPYALSPVLPKALTIPQGVPSLLLEHRPDITEALQTLHGKNALIGVEKSAYFPSFSLTGSLGQQSESLDAIVHSSATKWSLAPGLSVPIFDFGRIEQRVAISKTDLQTALVGYEQTVKKAYKEVYDALAKTQTLRRQYALQEEELNAYRNVLSLTQKRFDRGVANPLEVIDARKNVLSGSLALVVTEQALLIAQSELFKALGGGWNAEELILSKESL